MKVDLFRHKYAYFKETDIHRTNSHNSERSGVFSPYGNTEGQGHPVTAKYSVTTCVGKAWPHLTGWTRLREKTMRHRRGEARAATAPAPLLGRAGPPRPRPARSGAGPGERALPAAGRERLRARGWAGRCPDSGGTGTGAGRGRTERMTAAPGTGNPGTEEAEGSRQFP